MIRPSVGRSSGWGGLQRIDIGRFIRPPSSTVPQACFSSEGMRRD